MFLKHLSALFLSFLLCVAVSPIRSARAQVFDMRSVDIQSACANVIPPRVFQERQKKEYATWLLKNSPSIYKPLADPKGGQNALSAWEKEHRAFRTELRSKKSEHEQLYSFCSMQPRGTRRAFSSPSTTRTYFQGPALPTFRALDSARRFRLSPRTIRRGWEYQHTDRSSSE